MESAESNKVSSEIAFVQAQRWDNPTRHSCRPRISTPLIKNLRGFSSVRRLNSSVGLLFVSESI